jgi:quercetin dioxygenase-like cupin family protein
LAGVVAERRDVSRFVMGGEVPVESFDWGTAGMRCAPPGTGCESFVVMDVRLDPGFFHAFHKHPDQDEMIIVKSGRVTQWLADEHTELGPGDSVYIDKDVVHGSYNDFSEPAELQVVLAPAVGDGGYVAVDVSAEEPWVSKR